VNGRRVESPTSGHTVGRRDGGKQPFSGPGGRRRGDEKVFLIWIGRKVQSLFRDRGGFVSGLGENR
jgi:hypothetical protein